MSDREAERQKRLREALRENLKRRKVQARGRSARSDHDEREAACDVPGDGPDKEITQARDP